jgi:hypothetical protein
MRNALHSIARLGATALPVRWSPEYSYFLLPGIAAGVSPENLSFHFTRP